MKFSFPRFKPSNYSSTLHLPSTSLPTRPHLTHPPLPPLPPLPPPSPTSTPFTLHDGPPYANGNLHIGHYLNKTLKDIVARYKSMCNYAIQYKPGWDCHGLPIELAAIQSMDKSKDDKNSNIIRNKCREFALETLTKQKSVIESWGLCIDWTKGYYSTCEWEYTKRQLNLFKSLVTKGVIHNRYKPVYWSLSTRTALAESELIYTTLTSKSVYIVFDTKSVLGLVVWTTTPWTLVGNQAIAVSEKIEYVIVEWRGRQVVVGKNRLEGMGWSGFEIKRRVSTHELVGLEYVNMLDGSIHRVVLADFVTEESGSGLVHIAPGFGMDDYVLGMSLGLDIVAPVDDSGCYSLHSTLLESLHGLNVLTDGTDRILTLLQDNIISVNDYSHRYPLDWRTNKPVIMRATKQWFCNIPHTSSSLNSVVFVPTNSRNRLESFTLSRKEWCISRQRVWGVPIPYLVNVDTGEYVMDETIISHIISVLDRNGGCDAWWTLDVAEFIPEGVEGRFRKGMDTMDVWFDSGSSWTMLTDGSDAISDSSNAVADVCIEGSDQHRGWFQSSLLTSVAVRGIAPYRTLITHGFVLDECGRKMSKSVGNVIDPQSVLFGGKKYRDGYGVDVLRLWVASCDYTCDVGIGSVVLDGLKESKRRLRSVMRYCLSNLNNVHCGVELVDKCDMSSIDRYMMHTLTRLEKRIIYYYNNYEYHKIIRELLVFNTNSSGFYFEAIKDRLYMSRVDSLKRRSAQTVLYRVLYMYCCTLAPITPYLVNEIKQAYTVDCANSSAKSAKSSANSANSSANSAKSNVLDTSSWNRLEKSWIDDELESDWKVVVGLKTKVNSVLSLKESKIGLEYVARVWVDELSRGVLEGIGVGELAEALVVSRVELVDISSGDGGSEMRVELVKSEDFKCPRCWKYTRKVEEEVCGECRDVIGWI